ncbi:MAG TPA: NAD(P)-dependent alcohol dehydrogenase [Gaiellaceae bacterium]|nr:NAD(P)-dependent alcohol dehydrogenase [Gaiellaceae bacterium]
MSRPLMRAVVHDRYGPPEVLRVEKVEKPVPAADELLVRVRATTVSQTDCHMRRARPLFWRLMLGLRRPRRRTLGLELAGEVEAVGSAVTRFAPGDRVFGLRSGAWAEYVCVRETGFVAAIPGGLTFEQAAAICDGANQALGHLTNAGVGAGTRLLVYGASGSCGTAAVQLGKHHFGAHVTAVCNTENVELVRALGADEVIDYEREDFTRLGRTWDVVLDAVGKHSFARSHRALAAGGVYAATDRLYNVPLALLTRWSRRRVVFDLTVRPPRENIALFGRLVEEGRYRPVVDRVYALAEVVEASRYVESWRKTGNVVLAVGAESP